MDLPQYRAPDFRTDFEPKRGPGFSPGAGGYFHGCSPGGPARIVFFGTDFGTERYWKEEVTQGGGEKRTQATLRNLRCLVEEAGVDPCSCHLTNAVLALAKRDDMTGNYDDVYRRKGYRDYLELCGDFHEDWISQHEPELVVLMGTPNILTYRHFVFKRALDPVHQMLEAEWGDWRPPVDGEGVDGQLSRWESVYQNQNELVRTEPGQPDVLWTFHPSFRNSNPRFQKLRASKAEKRKRREEVWNTVVRHLSTYA